MHTQYGNNFILLFRSMVRRETNPDHSTVEIYIDHDDLKSHYRKLLIGKKYDEADKFDEDTNFEQIGIQAWNKLNPLLQEAGKRMAKYGIDEKDFWG